MKRRALAGAALLVLLAGGLASRSMRTSCSAAWIAFRDPSRVLPPSSDDLPPVRVRLPLELEQPDLSSDFDRAADPDLADAGALSSFVLPDLPIPITQRTTRFVTYFAATDKGRQAFAERFRRAGRYRAHVEQAMRDADVPEDLVWMVAILSGFEPQATSPKGAAGLFQFMPETAEKLGLATNEWVDERRSIARATRAGVRHLRELFDRYGSWELALAAYNMGADNLDAAIAELKKRRGPRDASKPIELKDLAEARLVPKETANFVPQVQAFALVAANRGRFGLDDLDVPPPFELAELAIPPDTPLRLVSKAASIPIATLRDYDPEFLRDRTPPGEGDVLVHIPADKLSTALAALPVLLAQERDRVAAAASASASAASVSASASTSASAPPVEKPPPPDRFTLPNGILVERRATPSPDVTLTARVEVLEGQRAPRPTGVTFDADPITARPADLGHSLDRLAAAVRRLAVDGGDAATEARRRAGSGRRTALEKAPYGNSWLALGDRLFSKGTPLASAVLASPLAPLQSVVIAEPGAESAAFRAPIRVTLSATGTVDPKDLAREAQRAFAGALVPHGSMSPLSREERVDLTDPIPSHRILFAWLVPSADEAERAGLMLAILALAHDEHGRVARALTTDTHVAVRVRGFLDVGDVASVAAIEAAPSVLHDVGEVERELDRALTGFADGGPTDAELATAKANLRARLQAARGRAGTTGDPKEATLARIGRVEEKAAGVSAGELKALVQKGFAKTRRVVVITAPKG